MSKEVAAGGAPAGGDDLDLGVIWRALVRRRMWIALPTLLAFVGAFLIVNLITPRYKAETSVLLVSGDTFYTRPEGGAGAASQFDEEAVQSEVQVIMSRDLARDVIGKLGLVGNPEFDPDARVLGLSQRVMQWIGLGGSGKARPPEERVLATYYQRLNVFPLPRSRVVAIEFSSADPDLAARAANTIAESYLDFQRAVKQSATQAASQWLAETIEPLRKQVAEAEAKVEDFRARHGLMSGSAGEVTLPAQQLAELSAQLSAARSVQAEAEAKARLIRDMIASGRVFDIPDVANNEFIRRLLEQRIALRAQLALEERTLLPAHPRIKQLNAQIADLENQLRQEAQRTVRSLENEASLAAARVESVQKAFDTQSAVAAKAKESEVELRALEREARTQREQLETYLTRYREAQAREVENASPADARIVSRAVVPGTPNFPKKVPIIAIVTLVAFSLAATLVIALELLSGRAFVPAAAPLAYLPPAQAVSEPPRVEPAPAAPPVADEPVVAAAEAQAPPQPRDEGSAAATAEAGAASGALAPLLARLGDRPAEGRGRRVLVTEAAAGAGAAPLARTLADDRVRTERTILLDLTAEGAARGTGRPGLAELASGSASFSDVIGRDAGTRLHHVSAGTNLAAALAAKPGALELPLLALDQTYEWVILVVDAAGLEALAAHVLPHVDHAVLVSEEAEQAEATRAAYGRLADAKARDIIVVVPQAGGARAAA
ncbi:hypothetical protein AL346_16725 [Chelatococcus sp. CO-6]|uniref:GumC family protein n=1 Tax=Chelatococcus sp. CO-6 TaxID=1702325 RepID=UPI00069CF843|nr:GumC family protein [Chelatococcus sp. CO-6]ALA18753.1 hypothetical protein AL346_16725 [Chelatococcus sp. CO-6]